MRTLNREVLRRRGDYSGLSLFTRAISLIECLVVMAVGSFLVLLISSTASGSLQRVKNSQCVNKMRNLSTGILLYAQDHGGEFPRSYHSAAGAGVQPWAKAILPYMGCEAELSEEDWQREFEESYRCPVDGNRTANIYSYALNVFFELTPDGDDYEGSPATWRKVFAVEKPSSTILLAEPRKVFYADHVMAHLWSSSAAAKNALDSRRHQNKSNFAFVDGHIESLPVEATYDRSSGLNLWNPSLARRP